ncbi:hypothetical protein D3C78_423560 [compost metagenome]
MPFVHRHLAGDQRRAVAVAVVQQFEHVATLRCGKRCQAPVVQDQQVSLGVSGHQFGEATVAAGKALAPGRRNPVCTHAHSGIGR